MNGVSAAICSVCATYEVGSFKGGTDEYCSLACEAAAQAERDAMRIHPHEYDAVGDGWGYDDILAVFEEE